MENKPVKGYVLLKNIRHIYGLINFNKKLKDKHCGKDITELVKKDQFRWRHVTKGVQEWFAKYDWEDRWMFSYEVDRTVIGLKDVWLYPDKVIFITSKGNITVPIK